MERPGSSSLSFFQAVFIHVVVESSQPPAAESMSPLWSAVQSMQFPGTMCTCNQGPFVKGLSPLHLLCTQCLQPFQKMLLLPTPVRQTAHGNST